MYGSLLNVLAPSVESEVALKALPYDGLQNCRTAVLVALSKLPPLLQHVPAQLQVIATCTLSGFAQTMLLRLQCLTGMSLGLHLAQQASGAERILYSIGLLKRHLATGDINSIKPTGAFGVDFSMISSPMFNIELLTELVNFMESVVRDARFENLLRFSRAFLTARVPTLQLTASGECH